MTSSLFRLSNRKHALRALAFGAGGVILVWQIVTTSLVAYLADVAPDAAFVLASDNPATLLELAERKLAPSDPARQGDETAAQRPPDPSGSPLSLAERDEVRALVKAALAQAPLDARAFRILAELAPETAAVNFMEAAARRSLNESRALFWLLEDRFAQRRYADAVRFADILLRTRPQLLEYVTPFLARMAETTDAVSEVDRALAGNPPWRDIFLTRVSEAVSDARTPLRLMTPLKDTPFPPSVANLRSYLAFLLRHRLYDFAHRVWLQFVPSERLQTDGLLFNGGFESAPTGLQFDWTIEKGSGVTIDVAPRPDNPKLRALVIDYGQGRAAPHGVSEFVKLAPGAYRMAGQYHGELAGRRGLRWRVACIDTNAVLGESEMAKGAVSGWKRFEFDFVTPEKACPLQQVRLELDARSPSEWMVSGTICYADLKIERVDDANARSPR